MKRAIVTPLCFILGVLLLWQLVVMATGIPEYLLPAPLVIVATLEPSLLTEVAYTAGEAVCGFAIASTLAFLAAILFVRFRTIEQGLFPMAITLKTTPIVAIAPLLVLWLGTGWWSIPFPAMLISIPQRTLRPVRLEQQPQSPLAGSVRSSCPARTQNLARPATPWLSCR